MLASRELYELGRDVDVVCRIVDGLATTGAYIVFIPAIAVKLMLLTRVSERLIGMSAIPRQLMKPICNVQDGRLRGEAVLTVLHGMVLNLGP